jgi:hypothetical protein
MSATLRPTSASALTARVARRRWRAARRFFFDYKSKEGNGICRVLILILIFIPFFLFRIYAAKTYPEWQAFALEYLQKKYNAASNTFPEKKEMFTVG